jgi:hypothetical protein
MRNFYIESLGFFLLVLLCIGYFEISIVQTASMSMPERPERPLVFKTKQDLLNYLKKINEYYAIAGRPRFGRKRSISDENDSQIDLLVDDDLNQNDIISRLNEMEFRIADNTKDYVKDSIYDTDY